MTRRGRALLLCLALAGPGGAQDVAPPSGDTALADYADPSRWICRPGLADSPCSDGSPVSSGPDATTPPIDCFYVYPTASQDATYYSDLVPDAAEKAVARAQTSWLSSRCRVFAPLYHQATIAALRYELSRTPDAITTPIDIPVRDVRAAWRAYLARDNGGRGVVLVGHSQGTRVLQRLIAEEIDGTPQRRLLVAAYLPGTSTLSATSFRTIAPCRTPRDTACFVTWSSYRENHDGPRLFGAVPAGGAPVCVNPAALAGGRATLKAALAKPPGAPADAPPIVDAAGALSAECATDDKGAILRIRIEPGPSAQGIDAALTPSRAGPAWGLHPHDLALVRGDVLDLVATQTESWMRTAR